MEKRPTEGAFSSCEGLTTVTLGNRLKEIGEEAFKLLECVATPNVIKTIKKRAFKNCVGLTVVTLGGGLEEICAEAFGGCTSSLEYIIMTNAFVKIDDTAFDGCSDLARVKFCYRIKEFMSHEAMWDWWNQCALEKALTAY